jgi:hypothetical protein
MGRPKGSKNGEQSKVINICQGCKKRFETYPSRTRPFCSKPCQLESMGQKIDCKCAQCGQAFQVYESDVVANRRQTTYCTAKCMWKAGKTESNCRHCGKKFTVHKSRQDVGKGKYCSVDCLRKATPKIGPKVSRVCDVCGKEFKVNPHIVRKGWGIFCSKKCARTGENNPQWVDGQTVLYPPEWTRELRTAIRKRDGYKCRLCGKRGNHVHHIDYNKKNCTHKNLITLCHSCHAKTNFNRSKWIGIFADKLQEIIDYIKEKQA